MATPHKTTIFAAIKTALESITVAGGYKSTVVTVEKVVKSAHEVGTAERPWLCLKPGVGRERYEVHGPGHMWVTMPVYIGGHVQAATEDLVDVALENIEDDVIAAMYADPTLGDTAVDVRLIDGFDDHGDPDRSMGSGDTGFSGTFEQQWEITYERTTSST